MTQERNWYLRSGQLSRSFPARGMGKPLSKPSTTPLSAPPDVNITARKQLAIKDEVNAELEHLDKRWKQDRNKLVGHPDSMPTFGFGSSDPDSVRKKHDNLFTEKMRRQDRLVKFGEFLRQEARAEGKTLSQEFTHCQSKPEEGLKNNFSVKSGSAAPYKKPIIAPSKSRKP